MRSKNIASFHIREIEAIWISIAHSIIFFHKQTLYLEGNFSQYLSNLFMWALRICICCIIFSISQIATSRTSLTCIHFYRTSARIIAHMI